MSILISILITLVLAIPISFIWVKGIDNMKKNHPNYKGEDFLNWDGKNPDWDKVPTNAGRDGWDETAHTEGDF